MGFTIRGRRLLADERRKSFDYRDFPMWTVLLQGILLGLGAAVPLGPVNVEIARRTLSRGWRAGVALGLGAVSVDVMYAIVTSIGISQIPSDPRFYWTLRIAAAGVLFYLAIGCFRSAWRASKRLDSLGEEPIGRKFISGYLTGLLMTALNPMTLVFWVTVVPGSTTAISAPVDLPIICLGVFAGTLAWVLFFASLLHQIGQFRRSGWMAVLDAIGGLVLFTFAIATLLR